MYCECLKAGEVCGDECKCLECKNMTWKYIEEENISKKKVPVCTCSSNRCQKKYCECFKAGIVCNESCKCVGCLNCQPNDSGLITEIQKRYKFSYDTKKDPLFEFPPPPPSNKFKSTFGYQIGESPVDPLDDECYTNTVFDDIDNWWMIPSKVEPKRNENATVVDVSLNNNLKQGIGLTHESIFKYTF